MFGDNCVMVGFIVVSDGWCYSILFSYELCFNMSKVKDIPYLPESRLDFLYFFNELLLPSFLNWRLL